MSQSEQCSEQISWSLGVQFVVLSARLLKRESAVKDEVDERCGSLLILTPSRGAHGDPSTKLDLVHRIARDRKGPACRFFRQFDSLIVTPHRALPKASPNAGCGIHYGMCRVT